MSKINIRSPYLINTTVANLTSAKIDLYIYSGTQTTSRGAVTYSLDSNAFNNEVTFEISEFVKDFLIVSFDGSYVPQNIFVDYQITHYVSEVAQTPEAFIQLTAFDGYGYFEEGSNPELNVDLLQANTIMYNYTGSTLKIPVDTNNTANVTFYSGATQLQTTNITSSNLSNEQIQYVSFAGSATSAIITDSVASTTTIIIDNVDECKFAPYKITFINKFGALQDLWFFKRSDTTITTSDDRYKANILTSGAYSISDHQSKILTKSGNEKISLNSGFVDEQFNEVFRQLFLSEKVWIKINSQTLPVLLSSSSLPFKSQLNDKLINYTIELEYAFDKINNIR